MDLPRPLSRRRALLKHGSASEWLLQDTNETNPCARPNDALAVGTPGGAPTRMRPERRRADRARLGLETLFSLHPETLTASCVAAKLTERWSWIDSPMGRRGSVPIGQQDAWHVTLRSRGDRCRGSLS